MTSIWGTPKVTLKKLDDVFSPDFRKVGNIIIPPNKCHKNITTKAEPGKKKMVG